MSDRCFQTSAFQSYYLKPSGKRMEIFSSQLKSYRDEHSQITYFISIKTDLMKTDKNPELKAPEVDFAMG